MSKEVVKKEEAGLPAEFMDEMSQYAGAGKEEVTSDDVAIPFIRIIQKMSPQIDKRADEYLKDAEEGMAFNTVTKELFKIEEEPLEVIPVRFCPEHLEWKPRESGGGLVNKFSRGDNLPQVRADDKGRLITENGNLLAETKTWFVLAKSKAKGTWEPVVISMAGSGLSASKKWMGLVGNKPQLKDKNGDTFDPPLFAYRYNLHGKARSNDQGSWVMWEASDCGPVTDRDAWETAKGFSQAIASGKAQAKHTEETADDIM